MWGQFETLPSHKCIQDPLWESCKPSLHQPCKIQGRKLHTHLMARFRSSLNVVLRNYKGNTMNKWQNRFANSEQILPLTSVPYPEAKTHFLCPTIPAWHHTSFDNSIQAKSKTKHMWAFKTNLETKVFCGFFWSYMFKLVQQSLAAE